MNKPLIGIGCDLPLKNGSSKTVLSQGYHRCVEDAGGVPVLFPILRKEENLDSLLAMVDGFIMTGGYDLDPSRYSQDPHPKTKIGPKEREESDFQLLRKITERRLPLLTICFGIQELNVFFGGTLYQHIPEQIPGVICHKTGENPLAIHPIDIVKGSPLHEVLGDTRVVTNSSHHQAVKDPGDGLVITARTEDGVVEAIEHPDFPYMVGVQWHPELMPDDVFQRRLFRSLIKAAGKA